MKLPRHSGLGIDFDRYSGFADASPDLDWMSPNPKSDIPPPSFHAQPSAGKGHSSKHPVLLIEHNAEIRGLVRFALEQQGFQVLEASTGTQGIDMALRWRPKVIVLDMGITDSDGLTVIRRLRKSCAVPILALSPRANEREAISALDYGASDYIVRPFSMAELSARLRAAQRYSASPEPVIFRSGSLFVDLATRTVKVAERKVNLSATEYSLLELFVRHAGRVLTHAQILREVWGAKAENSLSYLRVYLLSLRKKLENPPEPELFLTERSVGYRLAIRET